MKRKIHQGIAALALCLLCTIDLDSIGNAGEEYVGIECEQSMTAWLEPAQYFELVDMLDTVSSITACNLEGPFMPNIWLDAKQATGEEIGTYQTTGMALSFNCVDVDQKLINFECRGGELWAVTN